MATRSELLTIIGANPGSTNNDLSEILGIPTPSIATRTKQLLDAGLVTREVSRITSRGAPVYSYTVRTDVDGKTKQERLAAAPKAPRRTHDGPIVGQTTSGLDTLVSGFVESFVSALAHSIAAQLRPRLENELQRVLPAVLPTIPAPHPKEVQAARPILPKVGVTNLMPAQAGVIQKEFGDTFDLVFCGHEAGVAQVKSMGISCEAVFHHTGHSGHHTEEVLKSVGAKIIRVGGGVSAMRDALTTYYVKEVAA